MKKRTRKKNARIKITKELKDYLSAALESGHSYEQIARKLGCCADTVKRIMSKLEIVSFDSAKFAFPPTTILWTKPCLRCKSDAPRPKNKYYCDRCRHTDDGLPPQWDNF